MTIKATNSSKTTKMENKPKPLKDTAAEIDDLFSVLSAAKKSKVETVLTKPETKKSKSEEVTLSDLEGLEEQNSTEGTEDSYASEDENLSESEEEEEMIKGVAYDPKRDDDFPAASKIDIGSDDFFDSRGLKRKTRPLTEDGLLIFTPNELKIGLGGGTDLCPFDCNCCF